VFLGAMGLVISQVKYEHHRLELAELRMKNGNRSHFRALSRRRFYRVSAVREIDKKHGDNHTQLR
jgi:hypothetical protein